MSKKPSNLLLFSLFEHYSPFLKASWFKVAPVVNTKLGYLDWFLYYLIILIKQCKIPHKTLDKALLFSKNQVFCLKNWKLWRAPTTTEFNIFCWNFAHVSYLLMSTKGCSGFFKILFRSWVICKNWKWPGFYTLIETSFLNNSRSKRYKRNPEHSFVDICKKEMCVKFQQKILNSVVVGARQSFQFFRQTTGFLENNRVLSKILYGILHYLISVIK